MSTPGPKFDKSDLGAPQSLGADRHEFCHGENLATETSHNSKTLPIGRSSAPVDLSEENFVNFHPKNNLSQNFLF